MTASRVDGREVIAAEPAKSPLSKPGSPIYFRKILKLLLDDSSEVYGCQKCAYTAPSSMQVVAHLSKHAEKAKETPGPSQQERLEEVTEDRDRWRRRALTAEHRLDKIRQALGD